MIEGSWGGHVHDRRRLDQPTDLEGLLGHLPARVLLDRMPGAVMGIAPDAVVAYANPAAVSLFGYVDGAMIGLDLSALLAGQAEATPADCMRLLEAAKDGDVVDWHHVEGYAVHTAVSAPLLLRATDPFLMLYITDVTELRWR